MQHKVLFTRITLVRFRSWIEDSVYRDLLPYAKQCKARQAGRPED